VGQGAGLRARLLRGELGAAPCSYPERVVSLRTRVVGEGGSGDPRGRSMIVTSAPVGSAIAETARCSTNRVPSAVTPPGSLSSLGSAMDRHQGRRSPPARFERPSVMWSVGPRPAWRTSLLNAALNLGSPVPGDARCALRWFVGVTTAQMERGKVGRSVRSESANWLPTAGPVRRAVMVAVGMFWSRYWAAIGPRRRGSRGLSGRLQWWLRRVGWCPARGRLAHESIDEAEVSADDPDDGVRGFGDGRPDGLKVRSRCCHNPARTRLDVFWIERPGPGCRSVWRWPAG